jgi:hypothetical protein
MSIEVQRQHSENQYILADIVCARRIFAVLVRTSWNAVHIRKLLRESPVPKMENAMLAAGLFSDLNYRRSI